MTYPLVGDLAGEGVPARLSCRVLGLSNWAYYKWRSDPMSRRDWDDAHLINGITGLHADDPEFGYRLLRDELARGGFEAGRGRIHRLCRIQGIRCVFAGRRGHSRPAGTPVHDDLVERDFTADAPNRLWLADIERHEALRASWVDSTGRRNTLIMEGLDGTNK